MKFSFIRSGLCVVLLSFFLTACSGGKTLRTERFTEGSISGIYDVFFYSNHDFEGLMYITLLDIYGDEYEIVPYVPEYYIQLVRHVKGKDALKSSLEFISGHPENVGHYIKTILNEQGDTIGFEIAPLFSTVAYGTSDVFNIRYKLMDNGKVKTIIDLKESVKSLFKQDQPD